MPSLITAVPFIFRVVCGGRYAGRFRRFRPENAGRFRGSPGVPPWSAAVSNPRLGDRPVAPAGSVARSPASAWRRSASEAQDTDARIPWRIRRAHAGAVPRLSRDHGHLSVLDESFGYLRQFVPQVLDAVTLAGGEAARELLEAVGILREPYALPQPSPLRARLPPARWPATVTASSRSPGRPPAGRPGRHIAGR